MQQIELELREDHVLFCPVTGEQVLFEDDFIPSKAMVFCYIEDEGVFQFANDWTQNQFSLTSADPEDHYLDFNKFHVKLSELKGKKEDQNLVCFSITTSGLACGPNCSIVHFCFDMDYKSDEKE
jgi:hypothetical protein